jgi:putative chitobiose transport system substrate-binding protein
VVLKYQGSLLTADGCRPAFEGTAGAEFFGFFHDLYRQQHIPPTVLTEGHRSAVTQFLSGQVAMIATGMQFLGSIRLGNPALYAQIEVAPQISAPGSPPNIAAMNLAVPAATREPELAFRLAAFVTHASQQLALARRVPLLPSARACYDDPLFSVPSGEPLLDQARAISVRQVFAGQVQVPPLRRYNKLRSSFVRSLQSAMAGVVAPARAIDELVGVWTPLLGCKA